MSYVALNLEKMLMMKEMELMIDIKKDSFYWFKKVIEINGSALCDY